MRTFLIALVSACFLAWLLGFIVLATVVNASPRANSGGETITSEEGATITWGDESYPAGGFWFAIFEQKAGTTPLISQGFGSWPFQAKLPAGRFLILAMGSNWHLACIATVHPEARTPRWTGVPCLAPSELASGLAPRIVSLSPSYP